MENDVKRLSDAARQCLIGEDCEGCYCAGESEMVFTCKKFLEDVSDGIENKSVDIEQIISDIENELSVSNSVTYRCSDGTDIDTDVSCIYYWFKSYQEVLRRKYGHEGA